MEDSKGMKKLSLLDRLYIREKQAFYSKHYNFRKHQAIVKRITRLEK
jgi:hypothetical protein